MYVLQKTYDMWKFKINQNWQWHGKKQTTKQLNSLWQAGEKH